MSSQAQKRSFTKLRRQSEAVSTLLKQLSHPQRLLILCSLSESEKSVVEIETACGASQSAVSQFLKNMRLEGFVESRRDGKNVYYKIVDQNAVKLIRSIYTIFCK